MRGVLHSLRGYRQRFVVIDVVSIQTFVRVVVHVSFDHVIFHGKLTQRGLHRSVFGLTRILSQLVTILSLENGPNFLGGERDACLQEDLKHAAFVKSSHVDTRID